MKTLIIYDATGKIYYYVESDKNTIETLKPEGLPYLTIEVPAGKYVESVDTSASPHVPIFKENQKPETDLMKEQMQEQQKQINNLTLALAEVLFN